MNLQELLDSLMALDHVVNYQHIKDYYNGTEKEYAFWVKNSNNIINVRKVMILVTDYGGPSEEATMYRPKVVDLGTTTFYDQIISALPTWLASHPTIEKYILDWVDETNEIAQFTIYNYNSADEISEKKTLIVYKVDGALTVRELAKKYTIQDVANGFAELIENGIGQL